MDREFVDRHRRQVAVQLQPGRAAVDRNPGGELGAQEQQVLVFKVLAQAARPARRQVGAQRLPGLTEILGNIDVGGVIIGADESQYWSSRSISHAILTH